MKNKLNFIFYYLYRSISYNNLTLWRFALLEVDKLLPNKT